MLTTTNRTLKLDRSSLSDWFQRTRARSRRLFDLIAPEAYYDRPIALRNPIVFYEGHLPAFNVNTVLKRGLGRPGVDDRLERLFARGIDPETEAEAADRQAPAWPARAEVLGYAQAADDLILEVLEREDLDRPSHVGPPLRTALHTIVEHEAMHQETLLYMWHRLPFERKRRPAGSIFESPPRGRKAASPASVSVPAGSATLGASRDEVVFGWDNEFPPLVVQVPAFDIDVHPVTNEQFMAFMQAGGYRNPSLWSAEGWRWVAQSRTEHPIFWEREGHTWLWRGMFDHAPLAPAWPVYVSHAEASAYARWSGGRLPSEAEFHRAAYGTPAGEERAYPWGDEAPDRSRGVFDFASWDPAPVASHPAGQSAWGVQDLIGNGWEWTSTVFGGFPGFEPSPFYPEYSADFFDGQHYVMKGGSIATATELVRRSFRNWFRPTYPYVYATFRCAR